MKTHTIKTPTAELLIVELSERTTDFSVVNGDETDLICAFHEYEGCLKMKEIPKGYTLLGKPDEIKEEDAKELVKSGSYTTTFWNYKTNDNHKFNQLKTATESLLSAIESVIFWENPKALGDFVYSLEEWEADERKTFDKTRTLIFVKN